MSYKIIDTEKWSRNFHCSMFINSQNPQYCITTDIDVTRLYKYVKENELSFTLGFIYAVAKCANEIVNFKYRFFDGKVVEFDKCNTQFTYLKGNDELFYFIEAPFANDMKSFINSAQKIIDEQTSYCVAPPKEDSFVFSPMPWFCYTSISHTYSGDNTKSSPAFDWGRFYEKDGKMMMPFSVQVHHSFVDGIHIARLVKNLQAYIDKL